MNRRRGAGQQPGPSSPKQPAEIPEVLPSGLPHPVGPRLMIEKGAFSSRTVLVLPDGISAPDSDLPA